jgi:hypothetical protein
MRLQQNTMTMALALTFAMGMLAAGCGSGDGPAADDGASDTYNQTSVSGKISGTDWTMASARVLMDPIGGEENAGRFELISAAVDDVCGDLTFSGDDKMSVIWTTTLVPGETLLGATGKSVTLVDGSVTPTVSTSAREGKYSIDSVSATSVAGRVIAHIDADNSVNGIFTAPRCCKQDGGIGHTLCPAES